MCGIGGFFGARPLAAATVAAMQDKLAPRGPDARHAQLWNADFSAASGDAVHSLLHARLAIIDPRPEADQPMSSADGRVWICYNGEAYGWQDDAAQLAREAPFRTRSDTEFILRAYEAWGIEALLPRLRGMFALAILDLRRGKLYLARDRMGKKPLLYAADEHGIVFASTLRAVLAGLPQRAFAPSADAIDAYLTHRYIPAPHTLVDGVRRLPNGCYLEFDLATKRLRETAWWTPQAEAGNWRERLDESIRLRTVADRPLGLFLSGGLDSTLLAARLSALPEAARAVAAFTAAFPGTEFDESETAARVAARFGIKHHRVDVPTSIRDDFARIVADLDEPFADPSAFPLWYLAREATKEVKVVLGGDGGDELFAGYKRYAQHLRSAWRRGLRIPGKPSPAAQPSRGARLRMELAMDWRDAYVLRFSGFSPAQRAFLQPKAARLPATWWRKSDAQTSADDPLEALLACDMDNYLPEYILRKGDLTTMAHGLELRAPLLDHVFYQSVLALPRGERFTRPAKRLFAAALPEDLAADLFAAKKRGFNPPLGQWLERDLAERYAGLGSRLETASHGRIDAAAADTFVAQYRSGARALAEQVLQLLILDESLMQLAHP